MDLERLLKRMTENQQQAAQQQQSSCSKQLVWHLGAQQQQRLVQQVIALVQGLPGSATPGAVGPGPAAPPVPVKFAKIGPEDGLEAFLIM